MPKHSPQVYEYLEKLRAFKNQGKVKESLLLIIMIFTEALKQNNRDETLIRNVLLDEIRCIIRRITELKAMDNSGGELSAFSTAQVNTTRISTFTNNQFTSVIAYMQAIGVKQFSSEQKDEILSVTNIIYFRRIIEKLTKYIKQNGDFNSSFTDKEDDKRSYFRLWDQIQAYRESENNKHLEMTFKNLMSNFQNSFRRT